MKDGGTLSPAIMWKVVRLESGLEELGAPVNPTILCISQY